MARSRRVTTGFVEVDGTSLYYEMAGSGHPLVLVHGGGFDCQMWDDQFERFADDFWVIRYSIRGYGRSALGQKGYSHVEDLAGLLKGLGIESAYLLGLSLGGSIVTAFAIVYPEQVDALVLVSTGGVQGVSMTEEEKHHLGAPFRAAERGEHGEAAEHLIRLWVDGVNRSAAPHVRERARAMLEGFVLPQARPDYPGERWPDRATVDHLGAIGAPTLIVVGEHDQPIIHRASSVLEARLSDARKTVIEDAAHMVNWEQPEAFTRCVLDFLGGLQGQSRIS